MSESDSSLGLPIPEGRRDEWALGLAQKQAEVRETSRLRLFLFRVGGEWFGIEPAMLSMTIPYARPRRLPHQRGRIIDGLVNADGRVIVCLSLERFAGVLPGDFPEGKKRLLVFSWQKWTFALSADEVSGVEDLDADRCDPLPSSAEENLRQSTRGIVLFGERAIICLDGPRFARKLEESLQ